MGEVLILLGLAYLAAVAVGYVFQRKLIYLPDPTRIAPAVLGLADVEEVELARPDGAQVIGWYGRAAAGQKTLLYFHGNGGNLAARSERMAGYLARGYGMFMLSYRGYSGSTGTPSERANVADAIAAHDWLTARGVPASEVVLYGESLGTGVAVQVALERPVAGVILDAPFTSLPDLAQYHYWYFPAKWLVRDRYPTLALIPRMQAPLLIIHGEHDEVTPVEMGRTVFAAANEPRRIAVIRGAGHNDHHVHGAFQVVEDWIAELPPPRVTSGTP